MLDLAGAGDQGLDVTDRDRLTPRRELLADAISITASTSIGRADRESRLGLARNPLEIRENSLFKPTSRILVDAS